MTVTLVAAGDNASTLNEVDPGGRMANIFNLPVSKAAIVTLLRDLLGDPEAREVTSGPVRIDRMRDGPRVNVGSGSFFIRYSDAIPLILEA